MSHLDKLQHCGVTNYNNVYMWCRPLSRDTKQPREAYTLPQTADRHVVWLQRYCTIRTVFLTHACNSCALNLACHWLRWYTKYTRRFGLEALDCV